MIMKSQARPSPMTATELIDEYFLENRHKLLDIAAFLDRVAAADAGAAAGDFRMKAFTEAVAALAGGAANRVEQLQLLFSDMTEEPRAVLDQKAARGAYDRWTQEVRS
jgi:hypothetical protein